jgi:hypothetical protein
VKECLFNAQSEQLLEGLRKGSTKFQSGEPVFGPGFERDVNRIRSRTNNQTNSSFDKGVITVNAIYENAC